MSRVQTTTAGLHAMKATADSYKGYRACSADPTAVSVWEVAYSSNFGFAQQSKIGQTLVSEHETRAEKGAAEAQRRVNSVSRTGIHIHRHLYKAKLGFRSWLPRRKHDCC
jgi:hypothetical protein